MSVLEGFQPTGVSDWGWTAAAGLDIKNHRRLHFTPVTVLVFLWGNWVPDADSRNVARYAVPADYHHIIGGELERLVQQLQRLYPADQYAWFCDASPVPEVAAAELAGLGVRGRHNLLLHPQLGTRLHIGEILTTLQLPPTGRQCAPLCSQCGKCAAACPADGLAEGFCKEKCLSYRTQQKGELSHDTVLLMQKTGIIWGCDICADVCPWNQNPQAAMLPQFYENRAGLVTPENLADLCTSRAYGWRGQAVMQRNLDALQHPAHKCASDKKAVKR